MFDPRGRIDRLPFVYAAVALCAVKVCIDYFVAEHALGANWNWQNYLSSTLPRLTNGGMLSSRSSLAIMLAVAAPFAWSGVVLTTKRLRSGGAPVWLVIFFFVPGAKFFLFALLCVLPPAVKETEAAHPALRRGPKWMRANPVASAIFAVALTAIVGALVFAITVSWPAGATYGSWLFLGLPFLMGFLAAYIFGLTGPIDIGQAIAAALMSLTICAGLLLAIAFEGLICLVMAAPIAICEAIVGAWIAHTLHESAWRRGAPGASIGAAIVTLPLLMLAERSAETAPPIHRVTSEVVVNAPRSIVWQHVIAFGEIPPPRELIFRAGIAYPKHATIDGRGVGAVRHCVFSTGAFVEPITVWDEPARLAFDVTDQPDPLRELSPYGELPTPHLDGYFKSTRGEFRLVETAGGRTTLYGTTWYENRMEPQFYWRYWSDLLIHRIHLRVLEHIKDEVERGRTVSLTPKKGGSTFTEQTAP